jgi:hypothetical protein
MCLQPYQHKPQRSASGHLSYYLGVVAVRNNLDRVAAAMLGLAVAFVLVQVALLLARRKVAGEGDAASPTWVYLSKLTTAAQQRYFIVAGVVALVLVVVFLVSISRWA